MIPLVFLCSLFFICVVVFHVAFSLSCTHQEGYAETQARLAENEPSASGGQLG